MVNSAFLGLGSNVGDRLLFIRSALDSLSAGNLCRLIKVSSIYETRPYGNKDQNNYLNCVCKIETDLKIDDLFKFTKLLEEKLGRISGKVKWEPREIDIDILFYNNLIYKDDRITVPHGEILNRDFVLIPLIEIEADYVHPLLNKKLGSIDIRLLEKHIVGKININQ